MCNVLGLDKEFARLGVFMQVKPKDSEVFKDVPKTRTKAIHKI